MALKPSKRGTRSKKEVGPPPWDGRVDDQELVRPGGALLAMLSGRARQLGHTRGELARRLGVTYGYIAQLASGHRKPEHISDEFAEACARYLGMPKVTIMMACGRLKPEDVFEKPDEIAAALPKALEYIALDPVFGPIMPPEVTARDAPARLQFFVVRLFEAARNCKLIPGKHSMATIAESLKKIEEHRRRLLKKEAS